MKKIKYLIIGVFIVFGEKSFAQANDDSFNFTNDTMNYLIDISKNDVRSIGDSVYNIIKLDANNYTITIIDSVRILLKDDSTNSYSGVFKYIIYNSGLFKDTATVYFNKSKTNVVTFYNSETNSDSVVNHFDLFQIGVFYELNGSPRVLKDTGTSFSPYKRAFWNQSNGVSNAATADINGDGLIDQQDILGIENNYLKSSGNYKPTLSPPSLSNVLYSKMPKDTFVIDSFKTTISVPINLRLTTPKSIYGLGYSYNVKYFNLITKTYEIFKNENFVKSKPWSKDTLLSKVYGDTLRSKKDILYCKTSRQSGPVEDTLFGITEIVVDEILIGIPNPGDRTSLIVNIFDIAMIDNNYNFIPISPISDTVILVQRDTIKDTIVPPPPPPPASISISNSDQIAVYPTIFQDEIVIRNIKKETLNIQLFDQMGRLIHQESIRDYINLLYLDKLNPGIYFLTIDEIKRVFKVTKKIE